MGTTAASVKLLLMLEITAERKPSTPLYPRQLDRAEPRGRAARRQSGVPNNLVEQNLSNTAKTWNCKGALGKTSGRSIFRSAPLRATSSELERSSSAANRKMLRAHNLTTGEQVAFARCRKSLLAKSDINCVRDGTRRCAGGLNSRIEVT